MTGVVHRLGDHAEQIIDVDRIDSRLSTTRQADWPAGVHRLDHAGNEATHLERPYGANRRSTDTEKNAT